mmetsp:Transcript_27171/g.68137  ORF Transcript_27171/g.68137 Transcript_27171/m.68137 type:complete len:203 (-) Transcript_27171:307-915(-)
MMPIMTIKMSRIFHCHPDPQKNGRNPFIRSFTIDSHTKTSKKARSIQSHPGHSLSTSMATPRTTALATTVIETTMSSQNICFSSRSSPVGSDRTWPPPKIVSANDAAMELRQSESASSCNCPTKLLKSESCANVRKVKKSISYDLPLNGVHASGLRMKRFCFIPVNFTANSTIWLISLFESSTLWCLTKRMICRTSTFPVPS